MQGVATSSCPSHRAALPCRLPITGFSMALAPGPAGLCLAVTVSIRREAEGDEELVNKCRGGNTFLSFAGFCWLSQDHICRLQRKEGVPETPLGLQKL